MGIDACKSRAARLDMTGIDLSGFRSEPLDTDALRCIAYMHDVEHHTICYLRDLLVTPAHRDPELTTFLAIWAFEELWHGEALARVLTEHDLLSGVDRVAAMRRRLRLRDRAAWLLHGLSAALIGPDVIAVQMAWGAVNEWTTQAGYGRLAARAGHPVLSELLRRIMRQEGRHIDFYASRAHDGLDRSRRARRLARYALGRCWKPVGAGVMPSSEVGFLARYLFGGEDGRAVSRRVDRNIDRLPGLDGLHLLESRVNGYTC